jgi:hypothetical protein
MKPSLAIFSPPPVQADFDCAEFHFATPNYHLSAKYVKNFSTWNGLGTKMRANSSGVITGKLGAQYTIIYSIV